MTEYLYDPATFLNVNEILIFDRQLCTESVVDHACVFILREIINSYFLFSKTRYYHLLRILSHILVLDDHLSDLLNDVL